MHWFVCLGVGEGVGVGVGVCLVVLVAVSLDEESAPKSKQHFPPVCHFHLVTTTLIRFVFCFFSSFILYFFLISPTVHLNLLFAFASNCEKKQVWKVARDFEIV